MSSRRVLPMRAGGRAAAWVPGCGLPVAAGSSSCGHLHGHRDHRQLVVSPPGFVDLWLSARAPRPPTETSPLLGTGCSSHREPCAPRLLRPEARPLPARRCSPACGLCRAHRGSTGLRWAAAPAPCASLQLPGQASSRPAESGWRERLVPALGWSVAAVPRGRSTRVGTAESPYVCRSLASRGRAGRLERHLQRGSALQPRSGCASPKEQGWHRPLGW